MDVRINKLKLIGNNIIVFQNSNGDVIEYSIENFIKQFTIRQDEIITTKQDEIIELLKNRIIDKEKIENINDREIIRLSSELNEVRSEKVELEKKISEILLEFNDKDISDTDELYQAAFSLFVNGKLSEAIDYLSEIKLEEELNKIQNKERGLDLEKNKLAETFYFKGSMLNLSKDYQLSIKNYLQAIELNPKNSVYWNDLGATYKVIGDFNKAYESLEKALQLDLDDFGGNSHQVGVRFARLGIILNSLGKFSVAEEYLKKSISIGLVNEEGSEVLVEAYFGLSELFGAFKDYKKSLHYDNEALKLLTPNNLNRDILAILYNNLGTAHYQLSNFSEALNFFEKSLNISKQEVVDDIFVGGNIFFNIGCAKIGLNNTNEGIELFKYAISIDSKVLGENHFQLAKYYSALAAEIDQFEEKKEFLLKSIEINEIYYGDNHYITAHDYYGYGIELQSNGNDAEAIKYLKKAICIQEATFGLNDVTLGKWYISLGTSYGNLKDLPNALKNFENGVVILRNNINSDNEHLNGNEFLTATSKIIENLKFLIAKN